MDIAKAVKNARRAYRLERSDKFDSPTWLVIDKRTGCGNGVKGDEAAGRDHFEKRVMFRALQSIDRKHDWHAYDWHLLSGPAEARVAELLRQRAEIEEARANLDPFVRFAHAFCRSAA